MKKRIRKFYNLLTAEEKKKLRNALICACVAIIMWGLYFEKKMPFDPEIAFAEHNAVQAAIDAVWSYGGFWIPFIPAGYCLWALLM